MLRDKCARCQQPMPISTGEFCPGCEAYREAYKLDLKTKQPDLTPDQILYAARRQMEATGWHSRSNYVDPRNFTRAVPTPPTIN